MSAYFKRLNILDFDPEQHVPENWGNGWKVYSICNENIRASCSTLFDLRQLEKADKDDARRSFINLLNRAELGQPFEEVYSSTQCHPTHEFKFGNKPIKVWRVWLSGKVRINFIYLPQIPKAIAILITWPKRKNKLSASEKAELEEIAIKVLNCLATNDFYSRVI